MQAVFSENNSFLAILERTGVRLEERIHWLITNVFMIIRVWIFGMLKIMVYVRAVLIAKDIKVILLGRF